MYTVQYALSYIWSTSMNSMYEVLYNFSNPVYSCKTVTILNVIKYEGGGIGEFNCACFVCMSYSVFTLSIMSKSTKPKITMF